jgi:DNA ligase (NAD+)
MPRLVFALGITGIGAANARVLCDHYADDLQAIRTASAEELGQVEGIGPVLAAAVSEWFADGKNLGVLDRLLEEVKPSVRGSIRAFARQDAAAAGNSDAGDSPDAETSPETGSAAAGADPIAGKTFVVTGKVFHFPNRDALKELIADRGGKVTGSVSAKTDYLINNDVTSTSSKNKKAAQLGIPILSEEDFMKLAGLKAE